MSGFAISATICDYTKRYASNYCVYRHIAPIGHGDTDVTIYFGVCKLNEVFNFVDARSNTKWREIITDRTSLTIEICYIGDRTDCYNERGRMFYSEQRPICNVQGRDLRGAMTKITCNETGVTYPSQIQCATAMGINQGALSAHLNNRAGYATVKGYTFRRGD